MSEDAAVKEKPTPHTTEASPLHGRYGDTNTRLRAVAVNQVFLLEA